MSNHIETGALPFIVCPRCEGHGTTGPGWVMTQDDVDEMGHEFEEYMENMQRGDYDVPCDECGGQRVVKGECPCDECEAERIEEAELRHLEYMERRYC